MSCQVSVCATPCICIYGLSVALSVSFPVVFISFYLISLLSFPLCSFVFVYCFCYPFISLSLNLILLGFLRNLHLSISLVIFFVFCYSLSFPYISLSSFALYPLPFFPISPSCSGHGAGGVQSNEAKTLSA